MSGGHPHVGASTLRVEDPALLTGRGTFVDDIRIPGTLHAAYVRSPFAHASIRKIEATEARALPGVHAVYTLDDVRPHLTAERIPMALSAREIAGIAKKSLRDDIAPFVLAKAEVCYVGEPVAMVVADSRYIAEDAAELVEIDYDPLDSVADCRDAARADAPRVHSEVPSNVLADYTIAYGDTDAAFARAAHVFRVCLKQHRGCGHSIEGRGVLARPNAHDGQTTIWTSTQSPHEVRTRLVELLGCDDDELRVITPDVGGGFGVKYLIYPEEVTVTIAARLLRRPVKWIEDRREHFLSAIQERDQYWDVEIALGGEAALLGVRGTLIHDQGAYTPQGINLSYNSATSLPGPYRLPSYRLDVKAVETNKVPTMPVRGAGYPEATFAMERLLDAAAKGLGIDRAEIRRRNLIPAEAMPYETPMRTRAGTPVKFDSGDFPRCQAMALEAISYGDFAARKASARREGRHLGIGIANGTKGTGRGPFETGIVRIGRSGRITVYTGAAAMGQSTKTMLAQIAADQFGASPEDIHVVAGDTGPVPMGHGGFASRQAVNAGTSVQIAATKVRDKALKVAAQLLNASADSLEFADGRVRVKGGSNLSINLGDIAREAAGIPGYALPKGIEPGLEHTENFMPAGLAYSNAAHAVELEVDAGTGAVRIRRYVIVSDCGHLINPMVVDGQIIGGAAHGIGNTLYERMSFDENGQPVTTNFGEYLLPGSTDVPKFELLYHESPSPLNPLGVKGVGEVGVIAASAAIVSAIEDALDEFAIRIDEVPIFPEQIVALVTAARNR